MTKVQTSMYKTRQETQKSKGINLTQEEIVKSSYLDGSPVSYMAPVLKTKFK